MWPEWSGIGVIDSDANGSGSGSTRTLTLQKQNHEWKNERKELVLSAATSEATFGLNFFITWRIYVESIKKFWSDVVAFASGFFLVFLHRRRGRRRRHFCLRKCNTLNLELAELNTQLLSAEVRPRHSMWIYAQNQPRQTKITAKLTL